LSRFEVPFVLLHPSHDGGIPTIVNQFPLALRNNNQYILTVSIAEPLQHSISRKALS